MIRTLIIGYGEVGRAHYTVLSKAYPDNIFYKDKGEDIIGDNGIFHPNSNKFDIMLIATQCNPQDMQPFYDMISDYNALYGPKIIDVLTTTPCGTVEVIQEKLGNSVKVNKSSIRGMHPHLDKFLLDIPKHIGGPSALELKAYYEGARITCIIHEKARTVEMAHILNNFLYGCNIMATNEAAGYCREMGVDWMEIVKYRESNNIGFVKAGFPSKVSPILYPSTTIGGHCVTYAPTTIPEDKRGPLAKMLAEYNLDK